MGRFRPINSGELFVGGTRGTNVGLEISVEFLCYSLRSIVVLSTIIEGQSSYQRQAFENGG